MSTQNNQTLNLHAGHKDYVLAPGISFNISFHGKRVDLRNVSVAMAEAMAKDKDAKYVSYSPERAAANAAAALTAANAEAVAANAAPAKK